jgi:hypothetical protein
LQVIERAILDRGDHALDLRLFVADDQRHPDALLAEALEQLAERPVDRSLAQQDDPAGGRSAEQLGEVPLDFGVVTQGESRAGLFGARAAVAVDDVECEALFHGRYLTHDARGTHAEAPRE